METVEDRRRLEQLPQVHDVLQRLSTAASLVVRLYHDVAAFAAGASR